MGSTGLVAKPLLDRVLQVDIDGDSHADVCSLNVELHLNLCIITQQSEEVIRFHQESYPALMRPPPHKLFNYRVLLIFKAFGYLFFSTMSHTVIDTMIEFEVVVIPHVVRYVSMAMKMNENRSHAGMFDISTFQ